MNAYRITNVGCFFCMVGVVFLFGCSTIQNLTGPSFDPKSYGVDALKAKVGDPDASPVDAIAAVKELANRNLKDADGHAIFELLKSGRNPDVNVAILRLIQSKDMSYLKGSLVAFTPDVGDPETATELVVTLAPMLEGNEKLDYARSQLDGSKFAGVRANACRSLAEEFPGDAEDIFIQSLADENNAVVASEICKALARIGSAKSLEILNQISNSPDRLFEEDNIFGAKVDSTMVRIDAVQAYETLAAIHGE